MKTDNIPNLNAILEYKNAILGLDSSIVCKTYENDLIFIIAIDDDKYKQFIKDINHIFYKLYSKFELEKKIVCMPNKFVSKWDTPIILIDSKSDVEVYPDFIHTDTESDFHQDLFTLYREVKDIRSFNTANCDFSELYEILDKAEGDKNGCAA